MAQMSSSVHIQYKQPSTVLWIKDLLGRSEAGYEMKKKGSRNVMRAFHPLYVNKEQESHMQVRTSVGTC